MNRVCCFNALLLVALSFTAQAQGVDGASAGGVPPTPPFVARAPGESSWVIEINPIAKGPPAACTYPNLPPKYLKQQLWLKLGNVMKCTSEWTDGTQTEDWVFGKSKAFQSPQDGGIHLFNPQLNGTYHDFSASDFEMLDWIDSKDYIGTATYAGVPCYHFRAQTLLKAGALGPGAHGLTSAQVHAPMSATDAYIAVRTHLPVAIIDGDGTYLYHFKESPPFKPVIPKAYAALLRARHG
ncbi:MAG TPA: hypothetical protein VGZ93_02500 [Candidatus Methylacidiphilales bacterium]|jgi:hypothetical protein|nr:hypothetical protein [Candidatus Methylacidiphilales bacterium]